MLPPRQRPPICCENHTRRYTPVPETPEEVTDVAVATNRWAFLYWFDPQLPDQKPEELPPYMAALTPEGEKPDVEMHRCHTKMDWFACACPIGSDHKA